MCELFNTSIVLDKQESSSFIEILKAKNYPDAFTSLGKRKIVLVLEFNSYIKNDGYRKIKINTPSDPNVESGNLSWQKDGKLPALDSSGVSSLAKSFVTQIPDLGINEISIKPSESRNQINGIIRLDPSLVTDGNYINTAINFISDNSCIKYRPNFIKETQEGFKKLYLLNDNVLPIKNNISEGEWYYGNEPNLINAWLIDYSQTSCPQVWFRVDLLIDYLKYQVNKVNPNENLFQTRPNIYFTNINGEIWKNAVSNWGIQSQIDNSIPTIYGNFGIDNETYYGLYGNLSLTNYNYNEITNYLNMVPIPTAQ